MYIATEKISDSEVTPDFTAAEVALYKRRLEEGYDLTTGIKYNAWLKLHGTGSKFVVTYVASKCYFLAQKFYIEFNFTVYD